MIRYEEFSDVRTWYIVFDKRRTRYATRWWHWIVSKHFAHCYLFTDIGDNKILRIEPLIWGTAVTVIDDHIENHLMTFAQSDVTAILSYTADYRKQSGVVRRGLITCVSTVKAILGEKGLSITPYQMYKKMLKRRNVRMVKGWIPYIDKMELFYS